MELKLCICHGYRYNLLLSLVLTYIYIYKNYFLNRFFFYFSLGTSRGCSCTADNTGSASNIIDIAFTECVIH